MLESVYIHIPFCKSICSYCDFCKLLYNGSWATKYLNALLAEINDSYRGEVIKTIYIGGGTPSALSEKELKYLFEIIKVLNLSDDIEFSFECNLGDINEELLGVLRDGGVNRLSIGIQSFDKEKLAFMERYHDFDDARDKIDLCHRVGFNNINMDLIYGIPGETLNILKKDLGLILKLKPDHISTYSLIVEDNTKVGISKINPIDEDLDYEMYSYISRKLKSKGYKHYEISNFALTNHESKHNLKYWNNLEYYGFGLGASGYVDSIRYENTRNLTKYLSGKYMDNQMILSKQDMMENEIMLGFRKLEGIDMKEFYLKYQIHMQDVFPISKLVKSKDLKYKKGVIKINPDRLYIMNEILIQLL